MKPFNANPFLNESLAANGLSVKKNFARQKHAAAPA